MIGRHARVVVLVIVLVLGGCERSMHDMYDQAKYKPLAPGPLFDDGRSERKAPPGSLALGTGATADSSGGRRGLAVVSGGTGKASTAASGADPSMPVRMDMALLRRGRQRYDIYCAPCHGASGDGTGMVVQRGFPAPPSYHTQRLRDVPDQHIYQVISDGYGIMYRYGDRIAPHDRWAIVAYIRALQLSRHAPRDRLEPQDLLRLNGAVATGVPR
jgi:mono/diheme cytochrome c family protein